MGLITDALRANLRNLAESDARSLRDLDQELIRFRNDRETSPPPSLQAGVDPKALLGEGRFEQQTVARLIQLCRDHRITGFSKLKKAELCRTLKENGVTPPPRPLESFSRKELIALVRQLMGTTE